jgi:hypothetical protein
VPLASNRTPFRARGKKCNLDGPPRSRFGPCNLGKRADIRPERQRAAELVAGPSADSMVSYWEGDRRHAPDALITVGYRAAVVTASTLASSSASLVSIHEATPR